MNEIKQTLQQDADALLKRLQQSRKNGTGVTLSVSDVGVLCEEIDSLKAQLANDSKRLDFMLKGNRVVVTNINWNENNERVGEGFCVNNVYWIDGWDRLTSSVHETERGAIDAAMIEAAQENSHD